MAYSEKELQKAKEILENCTLVSHSTKGCYSSRIALWIHFCNNKYAGDDLVTEERLASYVEWMVNSGAAERIRQGSTHIQQVLRNQLQGVLCYWRIQTGNRPDLPDPRTGRIFSSKWNEIVQRFPREGRSRRSEPIYGAYRNGAAPPEMNGIARHNYNRDMAADGRRGSTSIYHDGDSPYQPSQSSQSSYQYSGSQQQPYRQTRTHTGTRTYHSTYHTVERTHSAERHSSGYTPSQMRTRNIDYAQQASPTHPDARTTPRMSMTPSDSVDSPGSDPRDSDLHMKEADSPQNDPLLLDSSIEAQLPTPMTPLAPLEGIVPEQVPGWDQENAEPEGHLLALAEDIVLQAKFVETNNQLQDEVRAHHSLGVAAWLGSDARATLALGDIAIEDGQAAAASTAVGIDGAPAKPVLAAEGQSASVTQLPKSISIHIRDSGEQDDGGSTKHKAVTLRHANPLQCSWSALAVALFRRWHILDEKIPDFSTHGWQSISVFPGLTADSVSVVNTQFQEVLPYITPERLSGTKTMGDVGYFYADAFSLVKPTVAGVKCLDCVDAVDAGTVLPDVLHALVRINAGFPAEGEIKTPERFGIVPPIPLQKKIFPWVGGVLPALFLGDNNDQQRSVTRFLRLLRELRTVLLQDIAVLLEVPSLAEFVNKHTVFSHSIFISPEFAEYREIVRTQASDEIKQLDNLFTTSHEWVTTRKSSLVTASSERFKPTAPRLEPKYELRPRVPQTVDNNDRKRTRRQSRSRAEYDADAVAARLAKRTRRVYDAIASGSGPARRSQPNVDDGASEVPDSSNTEDVMRSVNDLRMENSELKLKLRKLELALEQHQLEVHTWMIKVERSLRSQSSPKQQEKDKETQIPQLHQIPSPARAAQPPPPPQQQQQPLYPAASAPPRSHIQGPYSEPAKPNSGVSLPGIKSLNQFETPRTNDSGGNDRYFGRQSSPAPAPPTVSAPPAETNGAMNRGYPTPATVTRSSQAPEMVTGNARHSQLQFQQPYTHSPPTRGLQLQLPNPSSRQHQMFSRSNEYRSPPMHSQYSVPPPPQAQQAPLPPPQQQSVNHGHYSSHHYSQQQQQQQQQYQQQQLPPATENTEHQWYRSQPEYQRHQYGNGPASPIHHTSRPAY